MTTRREFFELSLAMAGLMNLAIPGAAAANSPGQAREAYVDEAGVMRWRDSQEEVALFGVNYCLPSAGAFRRTRQAGASLSDTLAIDLDHLRRMGLDAVRLCFWGDWENSTADGDLIDNEHLQLLHQLIDAASARGMYMLLSPIVTYDSRWPDSMQSPSPGFSAAHRKDQLGLKPDAIAAQCRYLESLLRHSNPRTGVAMKDEPFLLAVETINEPTHHPDRHRESVDYIKALANAIRRTGFRKPIFYNVTQDMRIADAIVEAGVEGATYAWYPTGLAQGRAIEGNSLLLVDAYEPLRDARLARKAKLIYEFDAADSMARYMLPAMVREFRSGGAQFATLFTYDPLPIAADNVEFNDHFLNLLHTPGKAVSLMIAGEAFRRLPRGRRYGSYPQNMQFGEFSVDDALDVATMITDDSYLYSNSTQQPCPAPARLTRVAGCGSSPLVQYEGEGAYFLDKHSAGHWRLTVFPDAGLVGNPFSLRRPGDPVTRLVMGERAMTLHLPDLGEQFQVSCLSNPQIATARAVQGRMVIAPGVYSLQRNPSRAVTGDRVQFPLPAATAFASQLVHQSPQELPSGREWICRAQVVASTAPKAVIVHIRTGDHGFEHLSMRRTGAFDYSATVPAALLSNGVLQYVISVQEEQSVRTYPMNLDIAPPMWAFPRAGGWTVPLADTATPFVVFDADRDFDELLVPYGGYQLYEFMQRAAGTGLQRLAVRLNGEAASRAPENDVVCQRMLKQSIPQDVGRSWNALRIAGRSASSKPGVCGVILIERDGSAWGASLKLPTQFTMVTLDLASLQPVRAAMLPRDFPVGVNPYWLRRPIPRTVTHDRINLSAVQAVQLSAGARFISNGAGAAMIDIEHVALLSGSELT